MKLKTVCLLLSSVLLSIGFNAYGAGRESGGGDPCEKRIKVIRDDLQNWIVNEGHQGLNLPSEFSPGEYSDKMLSKIVSTKNISCLSEGDPKYPIQIGSTPKVCKFNRNNQFSEILCDTKKFRALSASEQYTLIHHEYAGLAGIEKPNGSDSNYFVSNQLSLFLEDTVVKKLAIKAHQFQVDPMTCKTDSVKFSIEKITNINGDVYFDSKNQTRFKNEDLDTIETPITNRIFTGKIIILKECLNKRELVIKKILLPVTAKIDLMGINLRRLRHGIESLPEMTFYNTEGKNLKDILLGQFTGLKIAVSTAFTISINPNV